MRHVDVSLEDRSYRISIASGLLDDLGTEISKLGLGNSCAIITDRNVNRLLGKQLPFLLERHGIRVMQIVLPPGEKSKQVSHVARCYAHLAKARMDRSAFIVAFGGGVVGDLAGFVAATWLRGIPFVQVPTTLLAQVDSSVGGKVGINLPAGKNLVGAFHQPRAVFCDLKSLTKLPMREYRAGMAEVIKYGMIYDADFFQFLERSIRGLMRRDPRILERVISRCCEIKAEVVAADERESGLRAILNFGHTIGHALEAVSQYGRFLHGEAISIGQVAAAKISVQLTGLTPPELVRMEALLAAAGLPTRVNLTALEKKRLFQAMQVDKKASGGKVRFVLADRIGHVTWGHAVENKLIEEALR